MTANSSRHPMTANSSRHTMIANSSRHPMILPTSYWPPVGYIDTLLNDANYNGTTTGPQRDHYRTSPGHHPQIEVMESFEKQTFRNRCRIQDLQGREIVLTVPVRKVEHKQLTRDIEIAYVEPWQAKHAQALRSAYEHTPYFEYFWDLIAPIYQRQWKYLVELNDMTLQLALNINQRTITPDGKMLPLPLIHTADWHGETWTDAHPYQKQMSILDRLFRDGY